MTPRSVMRFVRWLIAPDTAEGASPPVYEMECTTCADRSPASEDVTEVQNWALKHSGRNPSHTGYRGLGTSFWRTRLVDQADTELAPETVPDH